MVYLDGKDWNKHLDKVSLEKGSANTYKYFLFFLNCQENKKWYLVITTRAIWYWYTPVYSFFSSFLK